jgi:ROK family
MTSQDINQAALAAHGAVRLPAVEVDCYNVELKEDGGFVGDRASKGAFREFIEEWRKPLRELGEDPFGDEPSSTINKKRLDELLAAGDSEAAAIVHSAVESFAQQLAEVTQRFFKLKEWKQADRLVMGGGMAGSRVGELAFGRASVILKAEKIKVDIVTIRNDPDHAGLLGAAHLAPAWIFKGHDASLAVDIGGTNIRAGLLELNLKRDSTLAKARVLKHELWRHADDKPSRDEAVESLIRMLKRLIKRADEERLDLAPFIGIGCPGIISRDGSIERGAQNLPGNWESSRFNLPAALHQAIPRIGDFDTAIVMHNDAVVQGLSEVPFMQDVDKWGVFTVGTGLGNALFTNRHNE